MVREAKLRAILTMAMLTMATLCLLRPCLLCQVREAKLRAQHNKQRAQLKGYIRCAYYHGCYGCYGYFGYMTTYHDLLFTAYDLLLTTMPTH